MTTSTATLITNITVSFIVAIIYSFVAVILLKWFCDKTTSPIPRNIQTSVILFIISYILIEVVSVIRAIYGSKIGQSAPQYDMNHQIYYISYLLYFLFDISWAISFHYFLAIQLYLCFKNTFLEIKSNYIFALFAIYVLSICLYFGSQIWADVLSFWFPHLIVPSEYTLNVLRVQYPICAILYQLFIMISFNTKLFKFLQQTPSTSPNSHQQLLCAMTKQTNLMTLVISVGFIHYIIQYIYYAQIWYTSYMRIIWLCSGITQSLMIVFSVLFGFDFSNKYYYIICKYSDLCCIRLCVHVTNGSKINNKLKYGRTAIQYVVKDKQKNDAISATTKTINTNYSNGSEEIELTSSSIDDLVPFSHKGSQSEAVLAEIVRFK
eukprot:446757_1